MPPLRRILAMTAVLAVAALAASPAAWADGPVRVGGTVRIVSGGAPHGWTYSLGAVHARLGRIGGLCLDYTIVPPGFPVAVQTDCFFGSLARTEKIAPYEVTFSYGGSETIEVGAVIATARVVHLAVSGRPSVRVRTIRAPRALHTSLRFYAVVLDGSVTVRHVAAYDRRGRRVARK